METQKTSQIEPHCGMCEHSRPEPASKNVYCGRFPPTIQTIMRINALTKQPEMMETSMLPDVLKKIVCGEFKARKGGYVELCEPTPKLR